MFQKLKAFFRLGRSNQPVAQAQPERLKDLSPAFQGLIPATVATCSADGEPNVTYISQVYYVDEGHVALSFQFFNKTKRNVSENPKAIVQVIHPETGVDWQLELDYDHSESEGDLYDQMAMQLEAIASAQGMAGVFKLQAADVYEIKSVKSFIR
jgi:predicted pyridoxine 5'-phosphate oxidase superfamily flavin-nucleotide-binding protein